jgi:hypothetical protein
LKFFEIWDGLKKRMPHHDHSYRETLYPSPKLHPLANLQMSEGLKTHCNITKIIGDFSDGR